MGKSKIVPLGSDLPKLFAILFIVVLILAAAGMHEKILRVFGFEFFSLDSAEKKADELLNSRKEIYGVDYYLNHQVDESMDLGLKEAELTEKTA